MMVVVVAIIVVVELTIEQVHVVSGSIVSCHRQHYGNKNNTERLTEGRDIIMYTMEKIVMLHIK